MGCCLVALISLLSPRLALFILWIFGDLLSRAFSSWVIPLLGFFFLPLTTITYAWIVNSHRPVEGIYVILIIVAVIIDAGGWGHAEYRRRRW